MGDYDNDGDLDLLFSADYDTDVIYRNDGHNTFTPTIINLPSPLRLSSVQHAWGDYDNDGDLDIFHGFNYYRNDGNDTLIDMGPFDTDVAAATGPEAWGDYDNDGDLDFLTLKPFIDRHYAASSVYRNNGDGTFTDLVLQLQSAHYHPTTQFLGNYLMWGDYDNDGDLDILFAEDVYRNDGGIFTPLGLHLTEMGQYGLALDDVKYAAVHWGDYDSDGDLDIVVGAWFYDGISVLGDQRTILYRNDGNDTFTQTGFLSRNDGTSFGAFGSIDWGDYDNDGDLDLLLDGWIPGSYSYAVLFRNNANPPNLNVTMQVDPHPAQPGQSVSYRLDFTNSGGCTTSSAAIVAQIPVSLTNVSIQTSLNGVQLVPMAGEPYGWRTTTIAPGRGGTITIRGELPNTVEIAGDYLSRVDISSAADATDANNHATALLTVSGPLYVDDTAPGPAHDGLSWTTAFTNVPAALDVAEPDDEIWVAEGLYRQPAVISQNVALYGGFAATETLRTQRDWLAHPTILSGDVDRNDDTDPHGVVLDTDDINGSNARVVTVQPGADARLDGFTITGGDSSSDGGGIFVDSGANINVSNLLLQGNRADFGGGLANFGRGQLENVTFRHNQANVSGGAIYDAGAAALSLSQTTLENNSAGLNGGAIYHLGSGALTVNRALLRANRAAQFGGGVYNRTGSLTLTNVTLSGNRATDAGSGGAAYAESGALTLQNSSVVSNSAATAGGLLSAAADALVVGDSLLAHNSGGNCAGSLTSNDYNLADDSSCSFTGSNDRIVADVQVGPLDESSGVHALQQGSPAIDAGSCSGGAVAADQLGEPRPQGMGCDIGAYETPGACAVRVESTQTLFSGRGAAALQQAVEAAAPGDTLKIAGQCLGVLEINGSAQTLYLSKTLTLQGGYALVLPPAGIDWASADPLAHPTLLDAEGAGRVVGVAPGVTVTLEDLILTGGQATDGGGLYNQGDLTLLRVMVQNSQATANGGAIYNAAGGTLTVDRSTLSDSSASSNGGGLYNAGSGAVSVRNSTLSGNSAGDSGGGLANQGDTSLMYSTVAGNTAAGGANLYNAASGALEVGSSIVAGSPANNCAGGILSFDFNLDSGQSCNFQDTYDLSNIDPQLAPLQASPDNPLLVHPLLPASPVINHIYPGLGGCEPNGNDQRGVIRPQAYRCDSGAWEDRPFQPGPDSGATMAGVPVQLDVLANDLDPDGFPLVITGVDTPTYGQAAIINQTLVYTPPFDFSGPETFNYRLGDGSHSQDVAVTITVLPIECWATSDNGQTVYRSNGSLSPFNAVQQAVNQAGPGATVKIAGACTGVLGGAETYDGQVVRLTQDITLEGGYDPTDWTTADPAAHPTVLDAGQQGRVLYIEEGVTARLENLTITGGLARGGTEETGADGGGIFNNKGSLTLSNCAVTHNEARDIWLNLSLYGYGGGIFNHGQLTVFDSAIDDNRAEASGGGIHNALRTGTSVGLTNSTVNRNQAGDFGGGLNNVSLLGLMMISHSELCDNVIDSNVASAGGGINNMGGILNIEDSAICRNRVETHLGVFGGGINNNAGIALIRNSAIVSNTVESTSIKAAGAGLNNAAGSVTLEQSVVSYNQASAFFQSSGGGINNLGLGGVTVNESIISHNKAGNGGGIDNSEMGEVTVEASLIANNEVSGAVQAFGGGIRNVDADLQVINSTISANRATGLAKGGGIYNDAATSGVGLGSNVDISNSTIVDNYGQAIGGNLYNAAQDLATARMTINNTIVARGVSSETTTLNCANILATLTSEGHNLTDDGSCGFNATGDITAAEVRVGELTPQANGTWLNPLQYGSPAIDAGDCSGGSVTVDQRGQSRPVGSACDIGAYERANTPATPVPDSYATPVDTTLALAGPGITANDDDAQRDPLTATLALGPTHGSLTLHPDGGLAYTPTLGYRGFDTFTYSVSDGEDTLPVTATVLLRVGPLVVDTFADHLNLPLDLAGDCSLREAVEAANSDAPVNHCGPGFPGLDEIILPGGLYRLTLAPEAGGGDLDIASSISISTTGVTIDALEADRAIQVHSGLVSLRGLTLTHGLAAQGGALYNNGDLTLAEMRLISNSATIAGGAIYNASHLTLADSLLSNNLTPGPGGGLYNRSGSTLAASGTTFEGNAAGRGGGLYNSGHTNLTGVDVLSNTVTGDGGGVMTLGPLTASQSAIRGNSAGDDGGGLYNEAAFTATDSVIEANHAAGDGGGLYSQGQVTLADSTVSANSAANGGGLYFNTYSDDHSIVRSVIAGNSAANTGSGAGIYYYAPTGRLTVADSLLQDNHTNGLGGGIYSHGGLVINSSSFINNSANAGGGLYSFGLNLVNSSFIGNSAGNWGGAIYTSGVTNIAHTTVHNNRAYVGGGLADLSGSNIRLRNSLIINNSATLSYSSGGGDCYQPITSQGYNFDSDNSCGLTAASDNPGVSLQLALLGDYGGPLIGHNDVRLLLQPLFPNSPAENLIPYGLGGCGTTYTADARDTFRPQDTGCDPGAVETRPIPSGDCLAMIDRTLATYGSPTAAAVQLAIDNAQPGDLIKIAGTCTGALTRAGQTQTAYLSKNITLQGGYSRTEWGLSSPAERPTVLDANGEGRVLFAPAGVTATVDGLTLTGGRTISAAGVYNGGNLTLSHNLIRQNSADTDGGGVLNDAGATLSLSRNTLTSNSAGGDGGGLYNGGGAEVAHTTLSGNSAAARGGGLAGPGQTQLTFSTVVSNSAPTGSNLFGGGTFSLQSSLIAGPEGGGANCAGSFSSDGYNLADDGSCSLTAVGDQPDTDPHLGPLQDNGGASVEGTSALPTHALLAGSPAIDAIPLGNGGCQPGQTDQRDVARPGASAGCDVGAYEAPVCWATPDDGVTVYNGTHSPAVQWAIDAAPSGGEVKVAGVCAGVQPRLDLATSQTVMQVVYLAKDVTLSGGYDPADWTTSDPAAHPTTLDAQGAGRGVYVAAGVEAVLQTLVISGGAILDDGSWSNFYGGGIYNAGDLLTVERCTVTHNEADHSGGGIYNTQDSRLTLSGSDLANNQAALTGGGLYNRGVAFISNSTLHTNIAERSGGGIYNYNQMTVVNSTFSGNTAEDTFGGGIHNLGLTTGSTTALTVTHSTFTDNTAPNGGALYNERGELWLQGSLIADNDSYRECHNSDGTFTSLGYNLDTDGTCYLTAIGDQRRGEPRLGPLQDYGGPLTGSGAAAWTHALLAGSSALDVIPPGQLGCGDSLTADQRGFPRPFGAGCDVGAVERGLNLLFRKAVHPPQALPGAAITYTLAFTNHGLMPLTDIRLTDIVTGLADVGYQAAGVAVTPTGSLSYTWQVGPLAPDQGGVITLTGRLARPLAAGPWRNEATLSAEDSPTTAAITLTVLNAGPILSPIETRTITETRPVTITAVAGDTNGDSLGFTLADGPAGASIDSSGLFSWTPAEVHGPGVYSATIQVSDGLLTDSQTITLTVTEVNEPPQLAAIGPQVVVEETALTFTVAATDSDEPSQTLGFSLIDAPVGATISQTTGLFRWTPAEAQGPGVYTFSVVVSDTVITASQEISVTVSEGNRPPVLAPIGPQTVVEETELSFTAVATDSDEPAQPLTFSLVDAPVGATISQTAGLFTWTPTEAQGPGVYTFSVVVSDTVITASERISVTVSESNHAPVLADQNWTVAENSPVGMLVGVLAAADPDTAEVLTYTLIAGNEGAAFGLAPSGLVTVQGDLDAESTGVYTLTVQAADRAGETATATVGIRVTGINEAPRFTSAPVERVIASHPYSYTVTAADPDAGAVLTLTLVSGPVWLSLTGSDPGVAYLQGSGVTGNYPVELRVADQGRLTATQRFTLTVTPNGAPLIAQGGAITVTMAEDGWPTPFSLSLTGSDPENDPLHWTIAQAPVHGEAGVDSGAGATQTIAYTPTANYNGADSFTVQVDDGLGATGTIRVTVAITPVNDVPLAVDDIAVVVRDRESGPIFIAAANPVSITVLANDSDPVEGSPLRISAVGTPDQGGSAVINGRVIDYLPAILTGTETFTYAISDGADIATATVRATVTQGQGGTDDDIPTTAGETIVVPYTGERDSYTVTIQIPAGAVAAANTAIVYNELETPSGSAPDGYHFAGLCFTLEAYVDGVRQPGFVLPQPFTITLEYGPEVERFPTRSELDLYGWTGADWSTDEIALVNHDQAANRILFSLNQMAEFALFLPNAKLYLPLIMHDYGQGPDLVVDEIVANSKVIVITIRNAGTEAIMEPFWVDIYIDPSGRPRVNQPWPTLSAHGATWGVTQSLLPGERLSLVTGGAYYVPEDSNPSFEVGASVYGLVDSVNYETNYGNVRELNESNNLSGPVISTAGQGLP